MNEVKTAAECGLKITFTILLLMFPILIGAATDRATDIPDKENRKHVEENLQSMSSTIVIKVGSNEFNATLTNNPTAAEFKRMLPLTTTMTELNGNEKYFQLSKDLPTNASNPATINNGDIVLWGSNTLVLFYETFSTSYSYTKLGKIDNPTGLASALGPGNITISIQLK